LKILFAPASPARAYAITVRDFRTGPRKVARRRGKVQSTQRLHAWREKLGWIRAEGITKRTRTGGARHVARLTGRPGGRKQTWCFWAKNRAGPRAPGLRPFNSCYKMFFLLNVAWSSHPSNVVRGGRSFESRGRSMKNLESKSRRRSRTQGPRPPARRLAGAFRIALRHRESRAVTPSSSCGYEISFSPTHLGAYGQAHRGKGAESNSGLRRFPIARRLAIGLRAYSAPTRRCVASPSSASPARR